MRSLDLQGKCELGHVFEGLSLCDALARKSLFFPGILAVTNNDRRIRGLY